MCRADDLTVVSARRLAAVGPEADQISGQLTGRAGDESVEMPSASDQEPGVKVPSRCQTPTKSLNEPPMIWLVQSST